MRVLLLLLALGGFLLASAQQVQVSSLFTTVKPQGTVVVRKHPTGSEVVVVTMVDPQYPLDLLRQQATAIATAMGQEAQGLMVYHDQLAKNDPNLVFARAQFGIKGLSDPAKGIYRLEPIAKAFAGAKAPNTITGLAVVFEAMPPGRESLLRYDDDAVSAELSPESGQIGVEYRIALKTQDPTRIHIPEGRPHPQAPKPAKPVRPAPDWVTILFGGVAALACGALVYLFLLRARPQVGPVPRNPGSK